MIVQKHIYFPVKRCKYSIYSMVATFLTSLNEITGSITSLRMRNHGEYLKIYLFMPFKTSRDIVGQFLTILSSNTGLCSQVRPNYLWRKCILPCACAEEICRSGSISKNHQLTNLNKCGKFHACIQKSTILALSRLAKPNRQTTHFTRW